MAAGSEPEPDSSTGAWIGGAISTEEASAACQSSVGASVTTVGCVPGAALGKHRQGDAGRVGDRVAAGDARRVACRVAREPEAVRRLRRPLLLRFDELVDVVDRLAVPALVVVAAVVAADGPVLELCRVRSCRRIPPR